MSERKSEEPTVVVKLFVDKERSQVLFAESGTEFVDVLFSFLTMPLGTIVRLLSKHSKVGCLNEVYKSVEDLSTDYFQTKACKTMLLRPLNAAADLCDKLKVKIDTNPRAVYACRDTNCGSSDCTVSLVFGSICKCGKVMEYIGEWPQDPDDTAAAGSNGVFVKECLKFIITDDLQIAPASTSLMFSLLDQYGLQDPSFLEQKIVQLNSDKITSLLKRSLTTKQVLTGYYFNAPSINYDSYLYELPENLYSKQAFVHTELNNMKIIVVQTKDNLSLLYAEVGIDFIRLLFGLLSIPLGSIIRTYGKMSTNGCVDSIYRSIDGSAKGYMNPEHLTLLQSPNVAPFYGSGASNMLQAKEAFPRQKHINACFKCFKIYGFSCHARCEEEVPSIFKLKPTVVRYNNCKVWSASPNCNYRPCSAKLREVDPKLPRGGSHISVGFVKQGVQKFMVTDDLRVLPLSLTSTFQVVSESKIPSNDLVEREITLTKVQVMELLRAAVVTRNTLSSVLLPPRKKLHRLSSSLC
ncbi:hypothetical protein GUJ93_ZPchr0458g22322 [Zizania palustris]|uniref:DUF674 family protein n=1 Tax=Zizania palustris TaxID=103762 RepID=A0A8J5RR52_ZIZPA|nr:hypothetical protein GUJ93_ZPchr0458g22322 [Zizania palustris]